MTCYPQCPTGKKCYSVHAAYRALRSAIRQRQKVHKHSHEHMRRWCRRRQECRIYQCRLCGGHYHLTSQPFVCQEID